MVFIHTFRNYIKCASKKVFQFFFQSKLEPEKQKVYKSQVNKQTNVIIADLMNYMAYKSD